MAFMIFLLVSLVFRVVLAEDISLGSVVVQDIGDLITFFSSVVIFVVIVEVLLADCSAKLICRVRGPVTALLLVVLVTAAVKVIMYIYHCAEVKVADRAIAVVSFLVRIFIGVPFPVVFFALFIPVLLFIVF
jgi:hypothetical protein